MEKAAGNDIAPKRPCRNPKPTATLLEHSEGAALPSQQKKINDYRAAEAAKQATRQNIPTAAASSAATTPAPDDIPSPTLSSSHELPESSPGIRSIRRPSSGKRKATLPECEELDDQKSVLECAEGVVGNILHHCDSRLILLSLRSVG
jgi:hypothetical protein